MTCLARLLLLIGLFVPAMASGADLRALVAGINAYASETRLEGAVNDANAIAAAIRPFMREAPIVLRNEQVTREAMLRHWADLISRSRAGDAVLISFAGHGGRGWVGPSSQAPRGYREFWVMHRFNRSSASSGGERITGTDIEVLVARAHAAGVRTILLADHCYSGSVYRNVQIDRLGVRNIPPIIEDGAPPMPDIPPRVSESAVAMPPGLTSIAASRADSSISEFRISTPDGVKTPHGALSFAFARALTEDIRYVDKDGSGAIRRGALLQYLQKRIVTLADGTDQEPQLRPSQPADEVLFTRPGANPVPPPAAPLTPPAMPEPPLPMSVMGLPVAESQAIVANIPGAVWEPDPRNARLTWMWNNRNPNLIQSQHMFIRFGAPRESLPLAIAKLRATTPLMRLTLGHPMRLLIRPLDSDQAPAVYIEGDRVRLSVVEPAGPHVVVFNLTWDGRVEFLYPGDRAMPIHWPTARVEIGQTKVNDRFGRDHVFAVSSERSLATLRATLQDLNGRLAPEAARAAVLAAVTQDRGALVAATDLFSVAEADKCQAEVIRDEAMLRTCRAGGRP